MRNIKDTIKDFLKILKELKEKGENIPRDGSMTYEEYYEKIKRLNNG